MKTIINITTLLVLLFLSLPLLAHSGHDHNHWMSDFLHVLFFISVVVATTGICIGVAKLITKSVSVGKEEKAHD